MQLFTVSYEGTFIIKIVSMVYEYTSRKTISPVTGLVWPRGFQEVQVPRFRDNGTG